MNSDLMCSTLVEGGDPFQWLLGMEIYVLPWKFTMFNLYGYKLLWHSICFHRCHWLFNGPFSSPVRRSDGSDLSTPHGPRLSLAGNEANYIEIHPGHDESWYSAGTQHGFLKTHHNLGSSRYLRN